MITVYRYKNNTDRRVSVYTKKEIDKRLLDSFLKDCKNKLGSLYAGSIFKLKLI